MSIQTVNPTTGEVTKTYQEMTRKEVFEIIEKTNQSALSWREINFADRAVKLQAIADLLEERKNEYAELIACEMGKPITSGRAEIEKCAWVCNFYADNAEKMLAPRVINTEMRKSYVTYRPLGVIFAIMPWNFPFWQVFRFAAPNLMAGNGVILSHAPICTGTGLAIEQLMKDAGILENLFRTIICDHETAKAVIEHPHIAGVTLTGSVRAGKIVGSTASGALKKLVLELGGSDPYIVLEDADLDLAAEAIVNSRLNNSGQVCIAAKRVIAVDAIANKLEALILDKMDRFKMGNPLDEEFNFGPMAREDLRAEVHKQVEACKKAGAKIVRGGEIPEEPGFFYPPTFIKDVKKGMPAMDEEIFGPVIALIKVKDEIEAIDIANDSQFGLAAAVFTQNIKRGEDIAANKIRAGTCYVNQLVASDPRLPFGGIKFSGIGRELAEEGIREFVNIKTIGIK